MSIIHDTIVDGVGFRTAVYCAGCGHKCRNCHNPETWNIDNGKLMTIQEVYDEIISNTFTNVTFTGGDPMYQPDAFYNLACMIKQNSKKTIWCYTGFAYEEIIRYHDARYSLLSVVDVLVDGRYEDKLRSFNTAFRGSSNQRIIDVQRSLDSNSIILLDY